MLLKGWIHSWAFGFTAGWNLEGERVGEVETDEGFGRNLNLLAASDGVGTSTDTAASSGSDGCAFAAAEDPAEDSSDGCSAADLLCGVGSAAFAFDAVGISVDGDLFTTAIDDGEERAAFVVGRFLHGDDAASDRSALAYDDEAVYDDVGGDGAGEGFALLRGGAVEGLRDADGNGGAGVDGDVMEGRRRWRWGRRWWRWREVLRRRW